MSTDRPVETEITDEQRLDFILHGYSSVNIPSGFDRNKIDGQISADPEWQALWEEVNDVE